MLRNLDCGSWFRKEVGDFERGFTARDIMRDNISFINHMTNWSCRMLFDEIMSVVDLSPCFHGSPPY